MKEFQAPMTIADDATLYDVLPVLHDFIRSYMGHYAPSESFDDAVGRVECETLQKLIDAIDILIVLTPAINGK